MEWQPIETAPKDGTPILVYTKYGDFYVADYDDLFSAPWRIRNDEGLNEKVPTHWMLLPESPNAKVIGDERSAVQLQQQRKDLDMIGCIGHDGDCCTNRERMEQDARRYRWLKANHLQTGPSSWIRTGDDLEDAIDAAMQETPPNVKLTCGRNKEE